MAGIPAGIFRRLAAVAYDALLLIALLFVASFAFLPLTGGEAILASTQGAISHLYHALLVLLAFGYFGLCWTRGGQTLGMRAWRIRLQAPGGVSPDWKDAALRFALGATITLLAVAGGWGLRSPGKGLGQVAAVLMVLPAVANWLWVAVDGESRTLLDLAGRMRVIARR